MQLIVDEVGERFSQIPKPPKRRHRCKPLPPLYSIYM